jgi:hypothetical protein
MNAIPPSALVALTDGEVSFYAQESGCFPDFCAFWDVCEWPSTTTQIIENMGQLFKTYVTRIVRHVACKSVPTTV